MSDFVDDLQGRIAAALVRMGVSPEVAGMVGAEITADMARTWHGQRVYIGKRALDRKRLSEDVRRRFNGRNAREVARELDIGRATVYRHIKTSGRE